MESHADFQHGEMMSTIMFLPDGPGNWVSIHLESTTVNDTSQIEITM